MENSLKTNFEEIQNVEKLLNNSDKMTNEKVEELISYLRT